MKSPFPAYKCIHFCSPHIILKRALLQTKYSSTQGVAWTGYFPHILWTPGSTAFNHLTTVFAIETFLFSSSFEAINKADFKIYLPRYNKGMVNTSKNTVSFRFSLFITSLQIYQLISLRAAILTGSSLVTEISYTIAKTGMSGEREHTFLQVLKISVRI